MTIAPTATLFYAIVCGCLAAFAPSLGGRVLRAAIGAVVGFAAAALLAFLRARTGI